MKNISVGKKILLGFGAVIVMIAIILALTIVTSITRNRDLERVQLMSSMQQEANDMLNSFNLARVEIRTLFTSINAAAEYALAMEYLNASLANLDTMEGYSRQMDDYLLESVLTTRQTFNNVIDYITTVNTNDGMAQAAIEKMSESGRQMISSSDELFASVVSLTQGIAAEDAASGNERYSSVVLPVKAMGDAISSVQLLSRSLILVQDTSVNAELHGLLDEVQRQCQTIRGILTTDEARAAIDSMLASVDAFRASVDEAENIIQASDEAIAVARDNFLMLNEMVNNSVQTIAADVEALNASTITTSQITMFILIAVGAAAAVFSIGVAFILGRMITRPLAKMQAVMLQAGESGNLDFSDEVKADLRKEGAAKDELGKSLNAFTVFIAHILEMAECLKRIAAKDLTVEVELLGNEDTMGNALNAMLDNLNDMFGEINSIASQVATSSDEIAMGAQSLAQGSTEQASTVQEISASINEINEQMTTSNETANQAAQEGQNISAIAQEGNEKMNHMTSAMHEINDASQSIGNVIKVIDDIAFQTNILALNAAVEAARAGEHGKGFAVVADEVRNLAGKSADAAKETAALISANIEKTETGLTYTNETAESLSQIIEGIQATSQSLKNVADQSEAAKAATSQVNLAVDQVAQVVQQNSATSEQSAAASEEMSSQAQVLQQLIAQFKLRGTARPEDDNTILLPERAPAQRDTTDPSGGKGGDGPIIF